MDLPTTKVIRLERRGFRLIATIDDPATRNAMTDELAADLFGILDATHDDRSVRVLVLQGANGAFCAGANLKANLERLKIDLKLDETDPLFIANRRGGELYAKLNAHPMLVIAIVDGPAFGGGLGLTCCADIVLATPRARFALSETGLGIPPAQIAPYVVARIGLRHARRLALTGARFDGQEGAAIGLVDHYCPRESDLQSTLASIYENVGRCAPGANATTKRLLLPTVGRRPEELADEAATAFSASLRGEEGREGLAAFLEKRPARWVEKP
ncbi:MAG: enoyl-CoA hydratase/isomerase family protein [Methylobacteriaceae bacterium]|nr:enoyl-CoA hydratase/isomerase family protein [Methylobacteriaceae bacterium]